MTKFWRRSRNRTDRFGQTECPALLTTFSTIWKEGCPKRLCHLSGDTLLTPRTCFDATDGRGYNPFQQGPSTRMLFVYRSFTRKKFGWNTRKTLLSNARRWNERRFFFVEGIWRILRSYRLRIGVRIVEWPMCPIFIPAPLAVWTWSGPLYFSRKESFSSSPVMWSVAPVAVYHMLSTE
jgi:hypothetical protein